jgi:hypothetical protein
MKSATYRVVRRGTGKFTLEAQSGDGGWRAIEEFRNVREADATKAKLEKIAVEAGVAPIPRSDTLRRLVGASDFGRRAAIVHNLARAEQHVLDGDRRLKQQRRLVEALPSGSREFVAATEVLEKFKRWLDLLIADRDRLAADLAKTPPI